MFAVLAVAMMLIVPLTFAADPSHATAPKDPTSVPTPIDYGYVITYGSDNTTIVDVEVCIDGNMVSKKSGETIDDFWKFDTETGMGPFNSFYAAINLATGDNSDDSQEIRLSKQLGRVAYILDPNDLKKTLGGTAYAAEHYNVMLVVPTVYWVSEYTPATPGTTGTGPFVDGNGKLFVSGSRSFDFGAYGTKSGMIAYGHLFDSTISDSGVHPTDYSTGTIYPYIALGVYEGSLSGGKLLSQSGSAVLTGTTLEGFRGYAQANGTGMGTGTYMLWNVYGWTLYKIMAYTVIGTKDSQSAMGAGLTGAGSVQSTGQTTRAYEASTSDADAVSLFIENPWGNVWECLDDAVEAWRTYAVRNDSVPTGPVVSEGNSFYSTASQVSIMPKPITGTEGGGYYKTTSPVSNSWDLPGTYAELHMDYQPKIFDSETGAGGYMYVSTGVVNKCLNVGGCVGEGAKAGINELMSMSSLNNQGPTYGARLAYAMAADAVEADNVLSVSLHSNLSVDSLVTQFIPNSTDTDLKGISDIGWMPGFSDRFLGWNTEADGSGVGYDDEATINLDASLVLYGQWDEVYLLAFDADGGSGEIPKIALHLDETVQLPTGGVQKKDCKLVGWSYGDTVYKGTISNVFDAEFGDTVTMTAVWKGMSEPEEDDDYPFIHGGYGTQPSGHDRTMLYAVIAAAAVALAAGAVAFVVFGFKRP